MSPNNVDWSASITWLLDRRHWKQCTNAGTGNDHERMISWWNCSNNNTGLLHTGSTDAAICTISRSTTTDRYWGFTERPLRDLWSLRHVIRVTTWPEHFKIFGNFSDLRRIFRITYSFQIFENFQIFGNVKCRSLLLLLASDPPQAIKKPSSFLHFCLPPPPPP